MDAIMALLMPMIQAALTAFFTHLFDAWGVVGPVVDAAV